MGAEGIPSASDSIEFIFVGALLKAKVQGFAVSRTTALFAESYQVAHLTNGDGTQKERPRPYVRNPQRATTSSIGVRLLFFVWYMSPGNYQEGLRKMLDIVYGRGRPL
jgi:hypothetical protein